MKYGENDLRILKALQRGEAAAVGSDHRVHLEMLGLAVDSAAGLRLTPKGAKLALEQPLPLTIVFDTRDLAWRELDALSDVADETFAMETPPPGIGLDPAAAPEG